MTRRLGPDVPKVQTQLWLEQSAERAWLRSSRVLGFSTTRGQSHTGAWLAAPCPRRAFWSETALLPLLPRVRLLWPSIEDKGSPEDLPGPGVIKTTAGLGGGGEATPGELSC